MAGNEVVLVGNMTRDAELRFTASGQATASFGLAVNRRWQNFQTKEWEERTSFFDVMCWRELAENVSESITKGSRVIVVGRLEQRTWETKEGDKRSKVEIVASAIGPDLSYATAVVHKVDREHAEGGSTHQTGRGAVAQQTGSAGGYSGEMDEPF